ncbi:MAG: class I SAM-dependent methyltransferase [Dehalococcoidia bacterium]
MPRSESGTPPLTAVETWLREHLKPDRVESARGLYELMPRQRNGQLPFVDVDYDPYNESHWADAARVADYAAHLPAGGTRVLDIGPGDGWPSLPLAALYPNLSIVGADASPLRAGVCTANAERLGIHNATFVVADAARLPFDDGSFDLVTAASSLEEADDAEGVLHEAARVLRPGGALRASYQDWRLGVPGWESVMLWSAGASLLYTYVRRIQDPPIERRYTVVIRAGSEAKDLFTAALVAMASGKRAYGETLLSPELGVPLLQSLIPHYERCFLVEMRRWSTSNLVGALRTAGFSTVRATVHSGEIGRHFARETLRAGTMNSIAPLFPVITTSLGRVASALSGDAMVAAIR